MRLVPYKLECIYSVDPLTVNMQILKMNTESQLRKRGKLVETNKK